MTDIDRRSAAALFKNLIFILATVSVYSPETTGGSFISQTGILSVTDVDRRSVVALFKNLIFIKFFRFSARTSRLTGLNNL